MQTHAFKTERFVKITGPDVFTVSVTKTSEGWAVVHTHSKVISAGPASSSTSFVVHDPAHHMETDDFVTHDFKAER